MNENHERQCVHGALQRTLAPVQGDPHLEARLLQQLQEAPHHARSTFRPAKLLLIPALLILLLTSAFAAERMGLFDMLLSGHEGGILSGAEELVSVPATLHAVQSDHADVAVVQSLRSGSDVLLLIEAMPRAEDMMLAPESLLGTLAENGAYRTMMGFDWDDGDALLTHAENAGRQLIALDIRLQRPGQTGSRTADVAYTLVDGELLPDGGMRLLLYAQDDAFAGEEELTLQLHCSASPVTRGEPAPEYAYQAPCTFDESQRSAAFMTLTLPAAPQSTALTNALPTLVATDSALPIDVPEAGIRITGVTLVRTPLYTRHDVRYIAMDGSNAGDVYFFLSDAEGNWLVDGLRGGSTVRSEDGVSTRLGYASALPGDVTETYLSVMTFGSAQPLALVRVPLTRSAAPDSVSVAPTPAP